MADEQTQELSDLVSAVVAWLRIAPPILTCHNVAMGINSENGDSHYMMDYFRGHVVPAVLAEAGVVVGKKELELLGQLDKEKPNPARLHRISLFCEGTGGIYLGSECLQLFTPGSASAATPADAIRNLLSQPDASESVPGGGGTSAGKSKSSTGESDGPPDQSSQPTAKVGTPPGPAWPDQPSQPAGEQPRSSILIRFSWTAPFPQGKDLLSVDDIKCALFSGNARLDEDQIQAEVVDEAVAAEPAMPEPATPEPPADSSPADPPPERCCGNCQHWESDEGTAYGDQPPTEGYCCYDPPRVCHHNSTLHPKTHRSQRCESKFKAKDSQHDDALLADPGIPADTHNGIVTKLGQEVKQLRKQCDVTAANLSEARESIRKLDAEVIGVRERLHVMTSLRNQYRDKSIQQTAEIEQLIDKRDKALVELAEVKAGATTMGEAVANLNRTAEEKDAAIRELTSECNRLRVAAKIQGANADPASFHSYLKAMFGEWAERMAVEAKQQHVRGRGRDSDSRASSGYGKASSNGAETEKSDSSEPSPSDSPVLVSPDTAKVVLGEFCRNVEAQISELRMGVAELRMDVAKLHKRDSDINAFYNREVGRLRNDHSRLAGKHADSVKDVGKWLDNLQRNLQEQIGGCQVRIGELQKQVGEPGKEGGLEGRVCDIEIKLDSQNE